MKGVENKNIRQIVQFAFQGTEFYRKEQFIVFTGSKREAENLSDILHESFNLDVRYLHGEIETITRETIEQEFSEGKLQILTVPQGFARVLPPFGEIPKFNLV